MHYYYKMCLCIETDKTNGRPGEIRSISLMGFVVVISDIDIFARQKFCKILRLCY